MAWVWFVLLVIVFVIGLSSESSLRNVLKTVKAVLEDETNTPEGKVASAKIIINRSLD